MPKFRITFKDPDCIWQDEKGKDVNYGTRAEYNAIAEKFLEFGEYVTIELDTDKKTAKVITVK